jgi:hypothetical protein
MDERQRQQISLIIEHELERALRAVPTERDRIFAQSSAKGTLRSGATVKQVIAAVEEIADRLLATLVTKCGAVSHEPAAFEMIEAAAAAFFNGLDDALSRLMIVTGGGRSDSVKRAADDLLNQAKSDIFAKIEIEKFAFDGETSSGAIAAVANQIHATPPLSNKGGKPLAAHWDEMWASIVVLVYLGELDPKTQADIERAMMGWFVDKEVEVGETAIRQRARQLWRKLEPVK